MPYLAYDNDIALAFNPDVWATGERFIRAINDTKDSMPLNL